MGNGLKSENTQRFGTNGVGNWSQLLIPHDTMTSSRSWSQAMTATEILEFESKPTQTLPTSGLRSV